MEKRGTRLVSQTAKFDIMVEAWLGHVLNQDSPNLQDAAFQADDGNKNNLSS